MRISSSTRIKPDVPKPPLIDPGGAPSRCWFAVYTTCRHEKKVAQHFTQRGIEHFLPLYRVNRKWKDGSRVTLQLPLFPGYVFVRICKSQQGSVLSVPGTLTLVDGVGGVPAPVPESAIEALRGGIAERALEPHPLLMVGQTARICSGAFAGMEGVVIHKRNGLRVILTLTQIMQSISVEVSEADLEPLDAAGRVLPQLTDSPAATPAA